MSHFTLPRTHAAATQQFEKIRKVIKDKDPASEIILPSIAGWIGCDQLNNWLLASSNSGIDYENTLFGDLIRLCVPNNTELIVNRHLEQLCSIFTALLADANTCVDLLDWFEGCIRQYQVKIEKNYETGRDVFIPTDLYSFGLAHLIIRLSAGALAQIGNIHLKFPDAFLLYSVDKQIVGSFSQTLARCRAADLPFADSQARIIQLFHLAHCAIKASDDSYFTFESRSEPFCPLRRTGNQLLPFYSQTASWLLLVAKPNEVPLNVFVNLTRFCVNLREFGNSPDTYNTDEVRQIVQTMVAMVGAANLSWETRAELIEGLMLLMPKSLQPSSVAPDVVPPIDWYVILAPLHPSETSDWRLQVVPALLRLFRDVVRGQGNRNVDDCASNSPLLMLIGYLFRIPEQIALIRNLAKPDRAESLPDLRRFARDILDRSKMLLDVMCATKRDKAKPAAAGAVAIVPAEDAELQEEFRDDRYIHEVLVDHLRILAELICSVPEMCHEIEIAQSLGSLFNGLLDHWMSTADDRRMLGEMEDVIGFVPCVSSMIREMAKCEEFLRCTAKYEHLRHIWWLNDMCCQSAEKHLIATRDARNFPELSNCRQLRAKCVHFERTLAKEMLVQAALTTTAPENFHDTITMQLMRNPVRLPVSKEVMDMSTIRRYFQLGQSTDPYTRTPLGLDQVQPQAELRQHIAKWKRDTRRRQERIYEHARAECVDPYYVPGRRMDLLVSNWWMEQYRKRQTEKTAVVGDRQFVRTPRKRANSMLCSKM